MKLILGDSLQKLKDLPTSTVDAIVTDPPYGWRFMGKAWDKFDIDEMTKARMSHKQTPGKFGEERKAPRCAPSEAAGKYDVSATGNQMFMWWTYDWAQEALRVLKPGGHMVVFCGPRTYHAMAMGVEMAGFEIRDQLQWLFGSGFPKSLSVDKAIDKAAGAEREVVGVKPKTRADNPSSGSPKGGRSHGEIFDDACDIMPITAPATDDAKRWQGFGTALKPANEPIVLARKPLEKGLTVAENVLKWGTGALSIDACRIATDRSREREYDKEASSGKTGSNKAMFAMGDSQPRSDAWLSQGRWPSNVLLDEQAAEALDAQTQHLHGAGYANTLTPESKPGNIFRNSNPVTRKGDSGGASRFFYVAKAGKKERSLGLDGLDCSKLKDYTCDESTELVTSILRVISALTPSLSIVGSGENTLAISPRECTSTTRTVIQQITESKTWNCLMHSRTSDSMKDAVLRATDGTSPAEFAANSNELTTAIGILLAKVGSATDAAKLATLEKLLKLSNESAWPKFSSFHPTVKPLKLMEYLCTLVAPPGAIILDPFMGSGTTGCAAVKLGYQFIGIEREAEYLEIARKRIEHWQSLAPDVSDDDGQLPLPLEPA